MTAQVLDAGTITNWVDADEWAVECDDNDDKPAWAATGELWQRIEEGKRRD